jgi:hypothetical protein
MQEPVVWYGVVKGGVEPEAQLEALNWKQTVKRALEKNLFGSVRTPKPCILESKS